MDFNKRLRDTLESIQHIADKLQAGQDSALQNRLNFGLEQYEEARTALVELGNSETTIAVDLLSQRAGKLRASLTELAEQHWSRLIEIDYDSSRISIHRMGADSAGLSIDETADLMMRLDAFDGKIMQLCRDLNNIVFKPRLQPFSDGSVAKVILGEHDLLLQGRTANNGASQLIGDLTSILNFLIDRLPSSIIDRLSENIMPSLIATFISSWLNTSVRTSLKSLPEYQALLNSVSEFAAVLADKGWQGGTDLAEWVEDAPKVWLAKRRETSLTSVRDLLIDHIHKTKVVERVETQMVAKDDIIAPPNGSADDWDAGWSEEEDKDKPNPQSVQPPEEEDMSAWDDDPEEPASAQELETSSAIQKSEKANGTEEDDPADAWGWDDQEKQSGPPSPAESPDQGFGVNGHDFDKKPVERELTLKETYTVTEVPDELVEMIIQTVTDAVTLRQPPYAESPIAPAAVAMYSIPTLILAGFRALAPTYYSPLEGGNMYLYNDSLRLASELTSFLSRQAADDESSGLAKSAWPSTRVKLDTDIGALSSFGKRAYGKEMESQRTILGDLLDGAQGFASCTEAPFAAECENAVAMTIDRIKEVRRQWMPILSKSALLQSLGSLLATVLNKVIVDICDLPDISEEQSTRLKRFCEDFTKLSDLFVQENDEGQTSDMTGMYTPNWFKFQYLGEIMESSLVEIKYLWQEGGLKLEFDADEVVDLVDALFAESDHRRRAIADIRRG